MTKNREELERAVAVVTEAVQTQEQRAALGRIAAEVKAVREELEELRAIVAEADRIREQTLQDFMDAPLLDDSGAEARLRRVAQLPSAWRTRVSVVADDGHNQGFRAARVACANDLEAALKEAP